MNSGYLTYINILSIFILFGAFHGVFLSIVMLFKVKKNKTANLLFSTILLFISLMLFDLVLAVTNLRYLAPWFVGISDPLMFLVAPLYYFYTKFIIGERKSFKWYDLFHTIPAILVIIKNFEMYLLPVSLKEQYFRNTPNVFAQPEWTTLKLFTFIYVISLAFHLLVYLVLSIRKLKKFEVTFGNISSNSEMFYKLGKLKGLTIFFSGYTFFYFFFIVSFFYLQTFLAIIDSTWLFIVAIFIHTVGYSAINQPDYSELAKDDFDTNETFPTLKIEEKYKSSSLSEEESKKYHNELIDIMTKEKLYLDNQLKLTDLAKKINISANYLSQIINQEENKNFYDFVNEFRIKESIKYLSDSKYNKETILGIAYDSGFNNKVSFNRTFKKVTGQTPSEFRSKQVNSLAS